MQPSQILEIIDFEQKKLLLDKFFEDAYNQEDFDLNLFLPLLRDKEKEIRLQTAFFLDSMEFRIPKVERVWFEFAMENFEFVVKNASQNDAFKEILYFGLKDKNVRVRKQILKYFLLENCQCVFEKTLFFYANEDYSELINLFNEEEFRTSVNDVLSFGALEENNTDYNRKKCEECLEILNLQVPTKKVEMLPLKLVVPQKEVTETPKVQTEFERFLESLQKRGIIFDGKRVYPKIQIGSITNRVTYKEPGLQVLSKADKMNRILPSENCKFLRFDFEQFEPRIFFEFLLRNFLISPEEVPQKDIYVIEGIERENSKKMINKMINGGFVPLGKNVPAFLKRFSKLVNEFRELVSIDAKENNFVTTIGGNEIIISEEETNFSGKAVNRIIQGSASDIFNETVLALDKKFANQNCKIVFLIYDEFWVEIPNEIDSIDFAEEVREFISKFIKVKFGTLIDFKIRG